MNIVYTTDDNFIRQVLASVISVFENNKDEDINIYILSKGVTADHQNIVQDYAKKYNQKVCFLEIGNVHKYFDQEVDTGGWNDIVLARLFLDKILPEDVSRVIYLDGDVIVRRSLSKMWNIDLGDNVLGAVPEPTISKDRKEYLDIENDKYYYNAGILLIDLDKWKMREVGKRIVDYFRAKGGKLFANDQDAINGELKNEILPISFSYNYCNTYNFYSYRAIKKMFGESGFCSKEEYLSIKNDPTIVHYLGEERPWREGNKHHFKDDYIKYFNMTVFADELGRKDAVIETGWKNYFVLWNTFNFIMKPFPMLRLHIINGLIPVMMKIRKRQRSK